MRPWLTIAVLMAAGIMVLVGFVWGLHNLNTLVERRCLDEALGLAGFLIVLGVLGLLVFAAELCRWGMSKALNAELDQVELAFYSERRP